ncbi:MAG: DUF488 domain-containing protein [Gammaproteobacteria bacterium]|jgi:uncharacterized protein (DUF488 family)|nr:DUF488 domain-containing protein [Gammaproteobacteria bacterium]
MSTTIYTVGHSNRSLAEFLAVLAAHHIQALVDIRAWPESRHNPQFAQEHLRTALDAAGIRYHWAGRQLGGMRTPRPDSPHIGLEHGLRGYADHMQSDAFATGIARLVQLANSSRLSLMCAEREPLQCHRSLLSDWLTLHGHRVEHLRDETTTPRKHSLRAELRHDSVEPVYDRNTTTPLNF